MTVSSTANKVSYSGNGSLDTFAYTFKIFADSDLKVFIRTSAGTETLKTISTHYTVTNAGVATGGNVVFTSGNIPASGETVVIQRELTLTQGTDYVENDPFPAQSHEDALDRLTFVTQQMQEELDRSIKASVTNTITNSEFTVSATDRANKVFAFDASGNLSVTQELGTNRGDWAASTSYAVRDLVKDTSTGNIFFVNEAHTSSGSQPLTTNANSAKYDLIVDAASATTSASAAASSATAAASSASTASTQASNASTSASTSSTQASNAASSATAAASSATAAAASATSAAASLDAFDDNYLGAKSSDPSTDNDGDALTAGDLYFNTSSNVLKVYNGSAWQEATLVTTATTAELNIMDGDTSASSTTVADADRVVFNDAGTMKQVAVTDLAAYFDDEITAMPNLVTTGALNSGSITSGFGAIDNGSSNITTTGVGTFGSLDISGDIDVDGTTNLDVVDIDGAVDMASTLQVDGAITSSAGATITTADNTAQLTIKSTDADASGGPFIDLIRDSSSPAANDIVGLLRFRNDNSAGDVHTYGLIQSKILDATDGSEDMGLEITMNKDGTNRSRIECLAAETVFNEDSVDLDFRVESNGNANMLVVDAGNDKVGIGTNVPANKLSVVGGDFGTLLLDNANSSHGTQILFQANGTANTGGDIQMSDAGGMKIRTLAVEPITLATSASAGSPANVLVLGTNKDVTVSDGDLVIGTSGHGISFAATGDASGATSELLDDYEEGTWTPVLTTSSGTPATYGTQQIGKYVKIGDLVHIYFDIAINQVNNSNTTLVSGHPFNSVNNDALAVSFFSTLAVSPVFVQFQSVGSSGFMAVGLTSAGTNITNGLGIFGNSARIIASGTYRTA